MLKLIDRGQVMLDYLKNLGSRDSYTAKYAALSKAVDEAPIVDAAPVVHSKWKIERCIARCINCGIGYRLSNGGPNAMKFKFCPNCGAKMDEENNHAR